MYPKQKTKLYLTDIMDDPAITWPAYYLLSTALARNEMLHDALIALHRYDMTHYTVPQTHEDIFAALKQGLFPIYKEKYVVGYFGGRMMHLDPYGWKGMPVTEEVFVLENWRVC